MMTEKLVKRKQKSSYNRSAPLTNALQQQKNIKIFWFIPSYTTAYKKADSDNTPDSQPGNRTQTGHQLTQLLIFTTTINKLNVKMKITQTNVETAPFKFRIAFIICNMQ